MGKTLARLPPLGYPLIHAAVEEIDLPVPHPEEDVGDHALLQPIPPALPPTLGGVDDDRPIVAYPDPAEQGGDIAWAENDGGKSPQRGAQRLLLERHCSRDVRLEVVVTVRLRVKNRHIVPKVLLQPSRRDPPQITATPRLIHHRNQ